MEAEIHLVRPSSVPVLPYELLFHSNAELPILPTSQ
jgi:hypothetical protein